MEFESFKKSVHKKHFIRLHIVIILSIVTVFGIFFGKVLQYFGMNNMVGRNAMVIPTSYLVFFLLVKVWSHFIMSTELISEAEKVNEVDMTETESKSNHSSPDHKATKWDFIHFFPLDLTPEFAPFFIVIFLLIVAVGLFVEGPTILLESFFEVALSLSLARAVNRKMRETWYENLLKNTALVFIIFWVVSVAALAVVSHACPGTTRFSQAVTQCLFNH